MMWSESKKNKMFFRRNVRFKTKFLKSALLSNMIFMLGLGFGRLLSIFIDGTPTFGYTFGTAAELFLGFYGFWVINNKKVFLQKNHWVALEPIIEIEIAATKHTNQWKVTKRYLN